MNIFFSIVLARVSCLSRHQSVHRTVEFFACLRLDSLAYLLTYPLACPLTYSYILYHYSLSLSCLHTCYPYSTVAPWCHLHVVVTFVVKRCCCMSIPFFLLIETIKSLPWLFFPCVNLVNIKEEFFVDVLARQEQQKNANKI